MHYYGNYDGKDCIFLVFYKWILAAVWNDRNTNNIIRPGL